MLKVVDQLGRAVALTMIEKSFLYPIGLKGLPVRGFLLFLFRDFDESTAR